MIPHWLTVASEVADALAESRPVVALESTLITHGLPRPVNLDVARQAEAAIRAGGAIPATIALLRGRPTVGLTPDELESLANANGVLKASRRDLGPAIARQQTAGTTVSATMALAHAAGIRVFATGGIGGAHRRHSTQPLDLSADLTELARTPVLVVCAGAKSILDLEQTLELLETLGVPVLGYRTDTFPAFYSTGTLPVPCRVDSPAEAAAAFAAHVQLGGRGMLLAQPIDASLAVPADEFNAALQQAESEAVKQNISGAKLTPFLLARLAKLTNGRTLAANLELIVANAKLAAEAARELVKRAA